MTWQETLRQVDPDRCRAAVFADESLREKLLVLYGFHYELAKIPEWVSEPMVGAIRYQWWRDAVEEVFSGGAVRSHEISTPLADVFRAGEISRYEVDQLINARERDIEREAFTSLEEAVSYAGETSGRLMLMAAKLCDSEEAAQHESAIMSAGKAWGLTGMARSWRFYHKGMLKALSFEDVLSAAESEYTSAKHNLGKVPVIIMPALAYTSLVPGFLKRMRKSSHDPLSSEIGYTALSKQLSLMGAVLRGKL